MRKSKKQLKNDVRSISNGSDDKSLRPWVSSERSHDDLTIINDDIKEASVSINKDQSEPNITLTLYIYKFSILKAL